jgi:hypothetical protein
MIIYGWGSNFAWKEIQIEGKPRIAVLHYKYFSLYYIFSSVHSRSYFLGNSIPNTPVTTSDQLQNFDTSTMEPITYQELKRISAGDIVTAGWYREFSLLLLVLFIVILIVGSISGLFGKSKTQAPASLPDQSINNTTVTSDFITNTQKLNQAQGVEFAKPIWDLEQIQEFLLQKDGGKYSQYDVAIIYSNTTQTIFDQFVSNITKNKTQIELEKYNKFQASAKKTGEFMRDFPSAIESFELNEQDIKNYFFKTKIEDKQSSFEAFQQAIEITKTKGKKLNNKYFHKIRGRIFEVTFDPNDQTKISFFEMLRETAPPNDGIPA